MTAPRTLTRRLTAIVLAAIAIAALLPTGASAAEVRAEPEHAYAVIRQPGGPEGIVVLEERPAGLFVGIGMTGVGFRVVTLQGATAPCGTVGFSTVRLGTFHPVGGRFAAGYVSGAADGVDTIASVRLMVGNTVIACRTLAHGDRDGVSCDVDPSQDDCPRIEYIGSRVRYFARLLRIGLAVPLIAERPDGKVVLTILALRKVEYRIVLGDASCAEGGGEQLGPTIRAGASGGSGGAGEPAGLLFYRLTTVTAYLIGSVRLQRPGDPVVSCVDMALFQRVARLE